MEKRVERLGYDVKFNPPGDGNCFFEFLKNDQFDASIQLVANTRTAKADLLCQLAAIFTGVFG